MSFPCRASSTSVRLVSSRISRRVDLNRDRAHTGSWVARMRNDTGRKVYKALGCVSAVLDYEKCGWQVLTFDCEQREPLLETQFGDCRGIARHD